MVFVEGGLGTRGCPLARFQLVENRCQLHQQYCERSLGDHAAHRLLGPRCCPQQVPVCHACPAVISVSKPQSLHHEQVGSPLSCIGLLQPTFQLRYLVVFFVEHLPSSESVLVLLSPCCVVNRKKVAHLGKESLEGLDVVAQRHQLATA